MQSYDPLTDNVNPLAMKHGSYPKIAFLIGIFTGWILEKRFVNYRVPDGYSRKKVVWLIAGIAVLYLIMKHLCTLFMLFVPAYVAHSLLAFVCTLFITAIYPLVLKKAFS